MVKKGLAIAIAALFLIAGLQLAYAFTPETLKKIEDLKKLSKDNIEMPETMAGVNKINSEELKKWLDKRKTFVILDNRPTKEYEAEHIPTAIRVGVDELLANGPKEVEATGVKKEDIIVTYCSGSKCWRSPSASALLVDSGYKNIYWLREGLYGWKKKGYPTAKGKEAVPLSKRVMIAVANLTNSDFTQDEIAPITANLRDALVKTEQFRVVSEEYMKETFSKQNFQKSEQCDKTGCLVEMGKLLGVEKVVGGTISKSGNMVNISLRLVNVETDELEWEFQEKIKGKLNDLSPIINSFAKNLASRQGKD